MVLPSNFSTADLAQRSMSTWVYPLIDMIRIRVFEETCLRLASDGQIPGALHPATGHEAIAVGVCRQRGTADPVVSYYRSHAHALASDAPPEALFAEILGRRDGVNSGKGGSMHLASRRDGFLGGNSIVGANVAIAAGVAMTHQIQSEPTTTIAFFGDGAMSAGVVLEALTIAAAQRLPILLVCEDNLYQDHTRSEWVRNREPKEIAEAFGIFAETADGNNVGEISRHADGMLRRIRSGEGPCFLQARTYLRDFHCQLGAAVPQEYRPQEEVSQWKEFDPIEQLEQHLRHGIGEESTDAIWQNAQDEMTTALREALAKPALDPHEALCDVTCTEW